MIRDRGRIKWNSLMLPEHVKMLRSWAEEDLQEQAKQLDEQKLEILNERAEEVMKDGTQVIITYFNVAQYDQIKGRIISYNPLKQQLCLLDEEEQKQWINVETIDQIDMIDE